MTGNNNAEAGANILFDTTLAVAVSNNNKAKTDTESEDEFLLDITSAKETAASTDIHGGVAIVTEVKIYLWVQSDSPEKSIKLILPENICTKFVFKKTEILNS